MKNFQIKIGITFKDESLLKNAFIHKSYVNEHRDEGILSNERLEFLGDAVLELVVTEYLYKSFPDQPEGILTNWRSALVKGKHLAQVGRDLELGQYLHLSRGEENGGGRDKNYILANAVEALIGSIYLDKGYSTSKAFIKKFILKYLEEILEKGLHIDPKSRFQEICQEKLGITPIYHLIKDEGPDHSKVFTMGVYINSELIAEGTDSSKQKAEQIAAANGLKAKNWENIEVKPKKSFL